MKEANIKKNEAVALSVNKNKKISKNGQDLAKNSDKK